MTNSHLFVRIKSITQRRDEVRIPIPARELPAGARQRGKMRKYLPEWLP